MNFSVSHSASLRAMNSLMFCLTEISLFYPFFERYFHQMQNSGLTVFFSLRTLKTPFHCLQGPNVADEKLAIICIIVPLSILCNPLTPAAFKIFLFLFIIFYFIFWIFLCIFIFQQSDYEVLSCVFLFVFILLGMYYASWICKSCLSPTLGNFC